MAAMLGRCLRELAGGAPFHPEYNPSHTGGALPFRAFCERVGLATITYAASRLFNPIASHSFSFTAPISLIAYPRKLLHIHCSGSNTSPRFTGLRCM